jgi:hypothetical protein
MFHRIEKALLEDMSATRNASCIDSIEWDRVLAAMKLRLVPTLGDELQEKLIHAEAAAFW